ncbi:unnamed protein product [Clavelina lepadiformis]|uniref:Uncharacterized protein n=1 Tax=Clavelina lepadiformis TaxID=159417 RepID=A0ABP0GM84_CLALP
MADGAQMINFSSEQETTLARRNLLLQMRVLVHGVNTNNHNRSYDGKQHARCAAEDPGDEERESVMWKRSSE